LTPTPSSDGLLFEEARMAAEPRLRSKPILEEELTELSRERERVLALAHDLEQARAHLKQVEDDIVQRLHAGARVLGALTAVVETVAGRCAPSWKEELLAHFEQAHGLHRAFVEVEVRQRWPAEPHEELVIGPKPGPKPMR
jgi:hypothetical protein